ncbi:MAG: glycoside hydrolase family 27 protein [Candidatus Dormibacteria bacterium]
MSGRQPFSSRTVRGILSVIGLVMLVIFSIGSRSILDLVDTTNDHVEAATSQASPSTHILHQVQTTLAPLPTALSPSLPPSPSTVPTVPTPSQVPGQGILLAPPMGWNGYNHFGRDVTAALVEAEARALVSSGMKSAGYEYVNLDGGWGLLKRNASGTLEPNPVLFPHGIAPVAAYVHSLGLKFGIYTSAGTKNCAGTSDGSFGHFAHDAATFASWGVDYVKLDWCYVPYNEFPTMSHMAVSEMIAGEMAQALLHTGRQIVFDINDTQFRHQADWHWAAHFGDMWRATRDIHNNFPSVVANFTHDVVIPQARSTKGWFDPDMLEIGNGVLTPAEEQAQFSLWSELAAPLIAGNDLITMTPSTRAVLTNRAVIAVDQDPLGRKGYAVYHENGLWVLTKPLANGDRAVVFFNDTPVPTLMSSTCSAVAMRPAQRYILRNLWTDAVTSTRGSFSAVVPARGVVMYRITPA